MRSVDPSHRSRLYALVLQDRSYSSKSEWDSTEDLQDVQVRTMAVAASGESDTKWTVPNDPRPDKAGSFLRRTNLDELPQFF